MYGLTNYQLTGIQKGIQFLHNQKNILKRTALGFNG